MKMTINGMEHTQSTAIVFQSDNYNQFNMIHGNRDLDMNKIKKILADIDRGTNLLKYVPILVVEKGKKLDIIDGQHRFVVAKKIKHPVHYIMAEDLSLYDIARMNSNTEKWKAKDFINCYIQLGNKNYEVLESTIKSYPGIPITTAICLLSKNSPLNTGHHQLMDKFHQGQFIAEFQYDALAFLSIVNQIEFSYKLSREFLIALHKIREANVFPLEGIVARVNMEPEQLKKQDHWRKYLTNLEEIVSKGKHKRVAIY